MLYVYGALVPLRLLEEIRFWKMQEREHTVVIRELVPALEPPYRKLLEDWEGVFARIEGTALQWIEAILRSPAVLDADARLQTHELLQLARSQSEVFVHQLFLILARSLPVKTNPVVPVVILHIIRESEYFLGVLLATGSGDGDRDRDGSQPKTELAVREGKEYPTGGSAAERRSILAAEEPSSQDDANRSSPLPRKEPDLTAALEGTWSEEAWAPASFRAVAIGGHHLPPLPYAYDALEPHIDAKTMQLHHDIHHQKYVDDLNTAERMLARARETGDYALVKHWEREAAFNGAGHYLHMLFWHGMKPGGGGPANGLAAAVIGVSFGTFDAFRKHFSAAAEKVEGGGWALLVWSPRSQRLEILQAEKHQNLSQWDVVPLLALDVWEHAYYLKYQTGRAAYIEAWWNTVNWDHVNQRLSAARHLKWPAS